jgi:hypothetical protein
VIVSKDTHADRRCLEYLVHFAKGKGKGIFRAMPDIYTALGVKAEKNEEGNNEKSLP